MDYLNNLVPYDEEHENNQPETNKKLNERMAIFCKEFVICGSPTEAYYKAGYKQSKHSHSAASNLMKHPDVKAEIERLRKEQEAKYGMTREFVLGKLKKVLVLAETADKKDLKAMLKALEVICKLQGFYAPQKMEVDGMQPVSIVIKMPDMNP